MFSSTIKKVGFSLISLALIFNGSLSIGYAQSQQQALSTQEVIANLQALVETYDVELSELQTNEVISECRSLQAGAIQALSSQLNDTVSKYLTAAQSIDSTIRFTANGMRRMSEDSSKFDLVGVHLNRIVKDFESAAAAYDKSLQQLLIVDCRLLPNLFVAGLEEVRFRQKNLVSLAGDIIELRDKELDKAFEETLKEWQEKELG